MYCWQSLSVFVVITALLTSSYLLLDMADTVDSKTLRGDDKERPKGLRAIVIGGTGEIGRVRNW